jgi:transposase InsO family protein
MMAWEQTTPFNGPNTDARDQSSPDRHIRLAPHGRSIQKYMVKHRGPPSQTWRTFLRNHADAIAAIDLCVVPTLTFGCLFAFLVVSHGRRRLLWFAVTTHPTAEWLARQLVEAFPWDTAPRYLIRDNDAAYGQAFTNRIRTMGIRDRPIAPRSPWQNPYVERLIGTLRRECLDHVLIFGGRHLHRVLALYRFITMRPARTWDWPRMHRYDDLSNDPDPSSPRQFCPDYIIATPGYDFQEGQGQSSPPNLICDCNWKPNTRR